MRAPTPDEEGTPKHLPVVGVGASAGGLEALQEFLGAVPVGRGLALVVVQHLDRSHGTFLVEILQRVTAMRVLEASEGARVEPDRVYVAPPGRDLTIRRGVLHLAEPPAGRGLHLPIDGFLASLAEDRGDEAIAVILSGMGADGSAGLRAIKARGGVTAVQEPTSAQFDGMPRSAIASGSVDVVARAAEIPARLLEVLGDGSARSVPGEEAGERALQEVLEILRAHTGHDFGLYKVSTISRRVDRRRALHQLGSIADYAAYLRANPAEATFLLKELMIGVTSFFRDPEAWECLQQVALPDLVAARPAGATLRAWVPGCSTGEEAYSLAIAFQELMLRIGGASRLQIFATDLDSDAIERARQAVFPASSVGALAPERLDRFFTREEEVYRVRKEIRDMVIFAPQNVVTDPPFTKLDLVSCRNLLIYLKPDLQRRLLGLFHYSLSPGGVMFLGSADSVAGAAELFTPIRGCTRLFRRVEVPGRAEFAAFPLGLNPAAPTVTRAARPAASLEAEADRLLLRRYAPPAVLVTERGDIVYSSGSTGRFLEPAAGKANWNVLAMARDGLLHPLGRALAHVRHERGTFTVRQVEVRAEGGVRFVDLTAQAIDEPGPLVGMVMIVFADAARPAERTPAPEAAATRPEGEADALRRARDECAGLRRELEQIRADMQASQQEMMSANEELQSTNEELQSTNEELSTSREEMQSMNEELQTLNAELQAKVEELSRASDDMRNLLDSTDIATIFLDAALRVRRYTAKATRLVRLIPTDVGRPISDLAMSLVYPELLSDASEVLRTLAPHAREVTTQDQRWYAVKIMPYRTVEDEVAGVVLTFSDITAAKALEVQLRVACERAAAREGEGR